MTPDMNYFTEKKTILERLIADGTKSFGPIIEILLNEAMKLEREQAINAAEISPSPLVVLSYFVHSHLH